MLGLPWRATRWLGMGHPEPPQCCREMLPACWASEAPVRLLGGLVCQELRSTPLFSLFYMSPVPLQPLLSPSTQALGRMRPGSHQHSVMQGPAKAALGEGISLRCPCLAGLQAELRSCPAAELILPMDDGVLSCPGRGW